ncbi:autophagy- protein 2 [Coemansia guatemalensis]|uniref:Autophagy-related protein 2 n=1 Tax=Coemansia guatemalensis TaxID=2761395 RepID=A0A9W8LW02_9FUNG|nr:autophagy- protein 2 [Coemansia guatemalensis]
MWPAGWSFSLPSWAVSNSLQKRLVKFLLRRTVGQFLKAELDDDNLDVQLSGGQVRLRNVELSEEALNDAIAGLPIVVHSGTIGLISVSVPWTQLWTGHCEIQIEDLVIRSRLDDDGANDDIVPDISDVISNNHNGERSRTRAGRSNMAESIAMTEGGASILTSSMFIADDFLRAETLGYGDKDEVFINKDVERLIANAHEERSRLHRSHGRPATGSQVKSERSNAVGLAGDSPKRPKSSGDGYREGDSEFADSSDAFPMPGSPGSTVQGLQVISEMVDRIISAVNIRVQRVTVECTITTDAKEPDDKADMLQLVVDSVELLDEKTSQSGKAESTSGPTRRSSKSSSRNSGDASPNSASGNDRDHPAGIEYKVVEFRTLHKVLEIRGLHVNVLSPALDSNPAGPTTILSTLGVPISAHARIHRRMPFSEIAPVQPKGTGTGRRKSETGESVYMGPMPGEFRAAKPAADSNTTDPSSQQYAGARTRNYSGEEPTTSGWDVSLVIDDIVGVVTKEQMARILAIVQTAAPLIKRKLKRHAMRDQYQELFGNNASSPDAGFIPQFAKWINLGCKHIYFAVVPQPEDLLDAWHESSLAVLRLKLETVKHLALYLKGISAKWESTPSVDIPGAQNNSTSGFMSTDFWAAMTRDTTARATSLGPTHIADASKGASGISTATISVYLQSFNLYDNCPSHHPVVLPLVKIDRSLRGSSLDKQDARSARNHAARNSAKYDIWIHATESDVALTINIAPIILVLNKELTDRLSVYQELIGSLSPIEASSTTHQSGTNANAATIPSCRTGAVRDGTESIEELMENLRLDAERKIPSNVAICSPLIRVWILLPGTAGSESGASNSSSQIRSRAKEDQAAPGHFCIDAVDAVITNIVNGTATSSQSPNVAPEGHMRHPHIQELLESRKRVGGSGLRVECEALHTSIQMVEGGSTVEHFASVHEPSRAIGPASGAVSVPRPHIEITMASSDEESCESDDSWHRPPAFDAFSAVNDNIRVRMAPESELTTTLEFERHAVVHSRVVISCHLPEADVSLGRATYQRLNAVVNDFLLWQSIQEDRKAAATHTGDAPRLEANRVGSLPVSVLVDVPRLAAQINSEDANNRDENIPEHGPHTSNSVSQRFRLDNTQLFFSNSIVEKGRAYASVESNQVRLSSFEGDRETEVVLSHTFATSNSPIITPQLSLFLLTSPGITEESEIVLKTTWSTVDFKSDSRCIRELEAFFSSSGTSGMVQPPPKPMCLSLNMQNSSLRWAPTNEPAIGNAVVSVDSLGVIIGINSPIPKRDDEELRYYIEGLSVFGRSADSQPLSPVDVSSDAWISTGRFWKDHGYAALLHMDMVDLASKTKEVDDGNPLVDLKLYSEALVVDACADSANTLPQLVRGLLEDFRGNMDKRKSHTPKKRRSVGPQILGQRPDDIFGDIEEDAFVAMPNAASHGSSNAHPASHSLLSSNSHVSSHSPSSHSFTHDFENGRDDIDALVIEDYFASHELSDVADEYEVVGGNALSPTSPVQPIYSQRAKPIGSGAYSGVPIQKKPQSRQQQQNQMPLPPPPLNLRGNDSSKRPSLDSKRSKAKQTARGMAHAMDDAEELEFSDDAFDLHDYVDMGSDGDCMSDDEDKRSAIAAHDRRAHPGSRRNSLKLQSRFARQTHDVDASVVLEPDFPTSNFVSQGARGTRLPKAEFIDVRSDTGNNPVKVVVAEDSSEGQFIGDSKPNSAKQTSNEAGHFDIIDDYFKEPDPEDISSDESLSDSDRDQPVLRLAVDVARAEVRLHSGQDWYDALDGPSEFSSATAEAADIGIITAYMDSLDDPATPISRGMAHGQISASMPERRTPFDYHSSSPGPSLSSRMPLNPPRATRRSAKPQIELCAVHVHSEYKQYAESSGTAFDLGLNVDLLEILDELESSEWSKFLTRRRDAKTGLPASLQSLATARNRQLLTSGTTDSDRVTNVHMRRQRSSRWPDSNAEPMIRLLVEGVRPFASQPATVELRVDVEISPLRCYIHQDALDFLIGFFEQAEEKSASASAAADNAAGSEQTAGRRKAWPLRTSGQPYFQIIRFAPINVIFDFKPRRMRALSSGSGIDSSLSAKDGSVGVQQDGTSPGNAAAKDTTSSSGSSSRKPVELLNFFPLEDAEMTLISVKKRGVAGISKLVQALGHMWLPHLTQTQIPGVVSGVTPLRSLVNIGSGVADLVILPLEHYRKDGRLMQGIRRGAQSFAKTTALEAIQLGAKAAINAQSLLEQAGDILNVDVASSGDSGSAPHSHESRREGMLSPHAVDDGDMLQGTPGLGTGYQQPIAVDLADWPDYMSVDGRSQAGGGSEHGGGVGTSAPAAPRRGVFNKSKYAKQPENLSEGMRQAYASLRSNVGDAMETILAIPLVVQEDDTGNGDANSEGAAGRSPVHGSLRAVVHAVPIAVFKPMIGATEAVSKTLLGLRNTMEPGRRGQLEDKYKSRGSRAKKN